MIGYCIDCKLNAELRASGEKEDVGLCKVCSYEILKDYINDKENEQ